MALSVINMKTISVHSYKGGTGKTTFLLNIAGMLAKEKKRVLAIDYDLRAPSFQSYFTYSGAYYLSDYLLDKAKIEEIICPIVEPKDYPLSLIFSSVEFLKQHSKQRDQLSRDDAQFLAKLFQLQNSVKEQYDYMLIDTIPGFFYRSIDAMAIADTNIVIVTPSKSNVIGLRELCKNIYSLLHEESKFVLLINKIEAEGEKADKEIFERDLDELRKIGEEYFDDVIEIPYLNIIAERIHAFEKDPNEKLLEIVKEIIKKM